MIPQNCKSFFDGCNNCGKAEDGKEPVCTKMGCEKYQEPKCNDNKN
jgi:hypothetical protein